ncbi:MAG: hypothetical protein CL882_02545 [Dehalococcoidia bacterium]|nr:hypothetical protein [Dehalococcoidia bacterium]|tara:strand:+ start:625 stop:1275 length:651 start_codon:yes stop_codon:yes gene_type:complete
MGNLSAKKVAGISIMLGPIIGCVGYFLNNIVALEGNDPSSAAVVPLINQNAGLTFVTGILIMIGLVMMLNGVRYLSQNMTGSEALSGYVTALVSIGIIGWLVTVAGSWAIAGLDMNEAFAATAGPVFALNQGINAMATILFGSGFVILAYCISQGDVHNKILAYIATVTALVLVVVQVLSSADVITDGELLSMIAGICFIIFTLWGITLGRTILSE